MLPAPVHPQSSALARVSSHRLLQSSSCTASSAVRCSSAAVTIRECLIHEPLRRPPPALNPLARNRCRQRYDGLVTRVLRRHLLPRPSSSCAAAGTRGEAAASPIDWIWGAAPLPITKATDPSADPRRGSSSSTSREVAIRFFDQQRTAVPSCPDLIWQWAENQLAPYPSQSHGIQKGEARPHQNQMLLSTIQS